MAALYKINPLILSEGRVFVANPPLYELSIGNRNPLFLRDVNALTDIRVKALYEPALGIKIANPTTKNIYQLKGAEYRDFIYAIKHVGDIIKSCADSLVLEAHVLESIIMCWNDIKLSRFDAVKTNMGLDEIHYDEQYNALVLTAGGVDIQVHLDKLFSEVQAYILPELQRFPFRQIECLVTTTNTDTLKDQSVSIIELFDMLVKLDGLCKTYRLKGLGEMTKEGLGYTCVDVDTRVVTTIKGVGDLERLYQLMGVDTTHRKALVMGT